MPFLSYRAELDHPHLKTGVHDGLALGQLLLA